MQFSRAKIVIVATLLALAGTAGVVVAQMESGDRGILPVDSSGTLEIGGIHVDVGAKDADSARYAGWRIAQREGFKKLWAKMHNRPVSEAPTLSDSALDGLVSSIVVEKEQIGPTRYIADLGVLFDRSLAGQLLGVSGEVRRSAPMLLIPVTINAGTATTIELKNPWQRAWAQYRTSQSPINYVRVSGLGVDPLLVNAAQTRRPGRSGWRNILDLYGAANVLIAEVNVDRLYPGGPAKAHFTARLGPDAKLLGSFDLTAKDSNDIPRMMNEGVRRMDDLFAQAFAEGLVKGDSSLITLPPVPVVDEEEETEQADLPVSQVQLLVASPDAAALNAASASLRSLPGVVGVTEASLALGGTSRLVVSYRGDSGALRSALAGAGWSVDYEGGLMRISRGGASAPAPSPGNSQ